MKPRIAIVVSFDDVRNYFKGESWAPSEEEGSFKALSEAYDVQLNPKGATYSIDVQATDDPSDSDSGVTDDPVEFISKFLGTGTEADDILKKMSSFPDPSFLSRLLRRAATLVESGTLTVLSARRIVRRGIVAMHGSGLKRLIAAVVLAAQGQDVRKDEMTKLKKEMADKGWKVSQHEDDEGRAVLEVDVSGVYTADIKLDSLLWDYSFQVHGVDESKETGVTDDPIQEFRKFYKKESTQDAKRQLKEKKSQKQEEGTVPAGKKKKEESTEREEPRKKVTEESTGETMFAPTALPPSRVPNVPQSNKYSD